MNDPQNQSTEEQRYDLVAWRQRALKAEGQLEIAIRALNRIATGNNMTALQAIQDIKNVR